MQHHKLVPLSPALQYGKRWHLNWIINGIIIVVVICGRAMTTVLVWCFRGWKLWQFVQLVVMLRQSLAFQKFHCCWPKKTSVKVSQKKAKNLKSRTKPLRLLIFSFSIDMFSKPFKEQSYLFDLSASQKRKLSLSKSYQNVDHWAHALGQKFKLKSCFWSRLD